MKLHHFIRHYFTPTHTNNFRAKLLHHQSLVFVIGILIAGNFLTKILGSTPLHILGFTSSITINEVVTKTNEERLKAGLQPLSYNEKLSDAARRKAANMISENYWAHNSPSGKSPWVWFKDAGYTYLFAGENLAKDFGSTDRMVNAWMASPTHRDNIVNAKYKEIGIAVVPATLQGSETVLVVQLFGTPTNAAGQTLAAKSNTTPALHIESNSSREMSPDAQQSGRPTSTPSSTPIPSQSIVPVIDTPQIAEIQAPKLNTFDLKKTLSIITTILFIFALTLDLILSESQVLSRRVGKNWAHIVFINIILLAVTIVHAGQIR